MNTKILLGIGLALVAGAAAAEGASADARVSDADLFTYAVSDHVARYSTGGAFATARLPSLERLPKQLPSKAADARAGKVFEVSVPAVPRAGRGVSRTF